MIELHENLEYYLDKMSKEDLQEYAVYLLDIIHSYEDVIRVLNRKTDLFEALFKEQRKLCEEYKLFNVNAVRTNKFTARVMKECNTWEKTND